MVKRLQLKLMLLLCALVAGSGTMWGQSDKSNVHTSNVTLSSGTACKVTISETEYDGKKLGSNGSGGSCTFSAPSGTKYIHIHAAAWNGKSTSLTVKNGSTTIASNINLTSDSNIKGTSTSWTLSSQDKASTDYYKVVTLSTALTSSATLTIQSVSERCAVWGVNTEEFVKSPIGTFASIANKTISLSDGVAEFDASSYFTKATGATQTVSYTVTPLEEQSTTGIYYADGYLCVEQYGEQEFTVTATPTGTDASSFEAVSTKFTVTCPDNRTSLGSITAISPTTVYVGETGSFTLTESYTGAVASKAWSLGTGEDVYLTLADEMFEGLKEGDVTVTVTANPTDATTYKPATASFPISVEYKYDAPALPNASIFTTTKSISIPAVSGADVYYTLDGSTPTKLSTKYTAAFELSATTTVKAIAVDADGLKSPVASVTYTKEAVLDISGNTVEFSKYTISGTTGSYDNGADRTGTLKNSDESVTLNYSGSNILISSGIQFKANTGIMTTQWMQNGSKALTITPTITGGLNYVITYFDGTESAETAATNNSAITPNKFPCKITFTESNGGASKLTKLTLTAQKDPIATDVSITDPGTLAKDATGTFSATSTDVASCTKSWSSNNSSVIIITNASTGAYTAAGRGTAKITYTITPEDATNYKAVSAERNVSVTAPVVITASDVTMTYGDAAKAIGATASTDYEGTLTYASGNTSIVNVDASGNVTAVAVGTTTITISAPADAENLYTAGVDKVINVTVSAPVGSGSTPDAAEETIVNLDLKSSSLPTGWTQTSTNNSWNAWSASSSNGAVGTAYNSGTRYSGTFDLITSEFDLTKYATAKVIFKHAGNYFGTVSDEAKLYVKEGEKDPVQLTINTHLTNGWSDYTNTTDLTTYAGKRIKLIFRYISDGTADHCGTWDVKTLQIKGEKSYNASATVAASGYGTYCYEYPLDLDKLDENVKAYIVTNVTGSTVEFTQITGTIKGGVPFILYGTSGSHTLYTAASSSTVPDGNMLEGTLAPKYITTVNGDYTNFGLSGGEFVKINDGTIPAHKAYLPILTANVPAGARLSVVFNDEATTGISTIEHESSLNNDRAVYDMQGRRVAKPVKGSLYIVGGKKFVVK